MTMKWNYDFHIDVCTFFDDELFDEEVQEKVVVCGCYGRGRTWKDLEIPRLPRCFELYKKIEECPLPLTNVNTSFSERKGRGRGRLLCESDRMKIGKINQQNVSSCNTEICKEAFLPGIQIPQISKTPKPDPRIVGFGRPPEKKRVVDKWTAADFPVLENDTKLTNSDNNLLFAKNAEVSEKTATKDLDVPVSSTLVTGISKKNKTNWKTVDRITLNERHVPNCVKKAFGKKMKKHYPEDSTSVINKNSSSMNSLGNIADIMLAESNDNYCSEESSDSDLLATKTTEDQMLCEQNDAKTVEVNSSCQQRSEMLANKLILVTSEKKKKSSQRKSKNALKLDTVLQLDSVEVLGCDDLHSVDNLRNIPSLDNVMNLYSAPNLESVENLESVDTQHEVSDSDCANVLDTVDNLNNVNSQLEDRVTDLNSITDTDSIKTSEIDGTDSVIDLDSAKNVDSADGLYSVKGIDSFSGIGSDIMIGSIDGLNSNKNVDTADSLECVGGLGSGRDGLESTSGVDSSEDLDSANIIDSDESPGNIHSPITNDVTYMKNSHGLDIDEEDTSDLHIEKRNDSLAGNPKLKNTKEEYANTGVKDSQEQSVEIDPLSIMSNCWQMKGECIIQVSGLPIQYDLAIIQDLIGAFGTIIDVERQSCDGKSCVRFKLTSPEECDYAVSCLHDADCLFPETNHIVECYRVS